MAHSIRRYKTDISERSTASDESHDTQSTAPTTLYSNVSILHADCGSEQPPYDLSPCTTFCARSSTETYSSTVESLEELTEEPEADDSSYDGPEPRVPAGSRSDLRPSTPADFAQFFPSLSRLSIRHDDTTPDGNMNLRVDTRTRRGTVQLFHLKMNDLRQRHFSLRRYERASGREVCHSARRPAPLATSRPALPRSVSHALASLVRPDCRRASTSAASAPPGRAPAAARARRQDSGYASDDEHEPAARGPHAVQAPPSNTIKLDFSNYAQVELRRRGTKAAKRYDFEYWGERYAWRRVERRGGVEYHLFRDGKGELVPVAHIVPELRSPEQVRAEERNGGWVPPCAMWIEERAVLAAESDVADVIVATGLVALVDDTIKRHFHPRARASSSAHLSTQTHPHSPFKLDMGPKALVEHIFRRRASVPGAGSPSRSARGEAVR
ncbi:hypothetical protein PZA11_007955 [Diplocarpon coronariae]|nr:hypothetical protein JHW43_008198 [Diplocarpon mali]